MIGNRTQHLSECFSQFRTLQSTDMRETANGKKLAIMQRGHGCCFFCLFCLLGFTDGRRLIATAEQTELVSFGHWKDFLNLTLLHATEISPKKCYPWRPTTKYFWPAFFVQENLHSERLRRPSGQERDISARET
jgi:hypothetical protein